MDSITASLITAFGVAAVIQTVSASYFEVAYALTNRMFPDGNLAVGSIEIPNHRVVTFFYPKWLYRGGQAAKWLQYLIAIPVVAYFGWVSAVIYLAAVMGAKLVMGVVSTSRPAQSVSLAIMRGALGAHNPAQAIPLG